MKSTTLTLAFVLAAGCVPLMAQTTPSAGDLPLPQTTVSPKANATVQYRNRAKAQPPKPFSRIAIGGGVGVEGINMQAAVNVNKFMNLRGTGNYLSYTYSGINVSGFTAAATANFATAGASVDFYPFPSHGLRFSPGVQFLNYNQIGATFVANGGTSFTLNDTTYYSAAAAPVTGVGSLGLSGRNPALTATVGWGNMIPRYGNGHWSFPFEVGAAFIGVPAVNLALVSGQVCTNSAGTVGCQPVTSDATLQANVNAQVAKYKNDLNPFQYYPIVSFGVAYSFKIR